MLFSYLALFWSLEMGVDSLRVHPTTEDYLAYSTAEITLQTDYMEVGIFSTVLNGEEAEAIQAGLEYRLLAFEWVDMGVTHISNLNRLGSEDRLFNDGGSTRVWVRIGNYDPLTRNRW